MLTHLHTDNLGLVGHGLLVGGSTASPKHSVTSQGEARAMLTHSQVSHKRTLAFEDIPELLLAFLSPRDLTSPNSGQLSLAQTLNQPSPGETAGPK